MTSFDILFGGTNIEIYNDDGSIDLLVEDATNVAVTSPHYPDFNCYCHLIKVTNLNNGISTIIEFYGSHYEYQKGVKMYWNEDLIDAFSIILNDVLMVIECPSIEDFMINYSGEFNDEINRMFEAFYMLKTIKNKLNFIGLQDCEIVLLANFLEGYVNDS